MIAFLETETDEGGSSLCSAGNVRCVRALPWRLTSVGSVPSRLVPRGGISAKAFSIGYRPGVQGGFCVHLDSVLHALLKV